MGEEVRDPRDAVVGTGIVGIGFETLGRPRDETVGVCGCGMDYDVDVAASGGCRKIGIEEWRDGIEISVDEGCPLAGGGVGID